MIFNIVFSLLIFCNESILTTVSSFQYCPLIISSSRNRRNYHKLLLVKKKIRKNNYYLSSKRNNNDNRIRVINEKDSASTIGPFSFFSNDLKQKRESISLTRLSPSSIVASLLLFLVLLQFFSSYDAAQALPSSSSLSVSFPTSSASSSSMPSISSSSSSSYLLPQQFSVYKIFPDASAKLSPSIQSLDPTVFVESDIYQKNIGSGSSSSIKKQHELSKQAATEGVIWLGEHHNSKQDHDLQAMIIENIYNQRFDLYPKNAGGNMAIGLEQIQVQYQPVLDAYIQGIISEEDMLTQCQWSQRWSWPFENYRSIFTLAQRLKIPLIALNVDSEDLAKVEADGFQGLDKATIQKYIKDPRGFSEFVKPSSYRTYSAYVIEPSYDLHKKLGILKSTISGQVLENDMSFRNFFSGRILWDEAMAGNAYQWTEKHDGGIMIGLVGADHVKFEKGVVGRYQRLSDDHSRGDQQKPRRLNVAVLLNPTRIDTLPSGSLLVGAKTEDSSTYYSAEYPDQITLQLRYLKDDVGNGMLPSSSSSAAALSLKDRELPSNTGGVLSLADYIVISNKMD